jgi:UDP-glucose 4-epimerase
VTGGAGFIGSHLVEALLEQGWRVRVLDDLSSGHREFLPAQPALELVVGDVRESALLRRCMEGVDTVFHQGALRSVPRSVEDPFAYHDVNATGTMRLLLAAREARVRRVVSASSSSVYGDQRELPLREDMTPMPISPYGVSKLVGEHYCRNFSRHYGLQTVSLRYFNVFGPRQDPDSEYAAVVARFIRAAQAGVPLEIHGDGRQTRDFTYVSNVVDANLAAAAAATADGEAYNVACGERLSVLDIARHLEEALGRQLPRGHTPARPGDVRDTLADIARAQSGLGYRPRVNFADGLKRTLASFAAIASLGGAMPGS